MVDPKAAERFFEWMFGPDWAPLHALIWTLEGVRPSEIKKSFWASNAEQAAEICAREAPKAHVYFGCCLRPEDAPDRFGVRQRGSAEDAALMPGCWLDIDMISPHRKGEKKLPKTIDDCYRLVEAIDIEPSIVVSSGFGLQTYYLFGTSIHIKTNEDLMRAANLSEAFSRRAAKVARRLGWDLDSAYSLDHVLRVPGTVNWKGRWHGAPSQA